MAMWASVQQLPAEELQKVRAIYDYQFPIEVRHCLANWIESKFMAQEPEDRQQYFLQELIQEIHTTAELMMSTEMFVTKTKLLEAANRFCEQYSHAPHELYARMQQCLAIELDVIRNATGNQHSHELYTDDKTKHRLLMTEFQGVRRNVDAANEEIRRLRDSIESYSLQCYEYFKNKKHLEVLMGSGPLDDRRRELEPFLKGKLKNGDNNLSQLGATINHMQTTLMAGIKENITNLCRLQSEVLDEELIKWKREQQLSGNGVQMQTNLNIIQEWCELLADLIWTTRQQVSNMALIISKNVLEIQLPYSKETMNELHKLVASLLSKLVTSTFVIEKQPPQVMKINTRFTATVRLLVGGQLNVHMNPPRVSVAIISEQQARLLFENKNESVRGRAPEKCGVIFNNNGFMEYQPTSRQLSISFNNLQLRKIKRDEKKASENVMNQKMTLYFQSEFSVGGDKELKFQVWALSLPIVVVVHINQEPAGWATITWDNAFGLSGRVPFTVPDKILWAQMAETLRMKFFSATGINLSEENLYFLAEKLFRSNLPLTPLELDIMTVSWNQFCKDSMPGSKFNFWEWFYMVLKIIKDYLRNLWNDGLIMGFIQKQQAEDMLSKCPIGTFLLRFSDSRLGGISIVYVENDTFVSSLEPFTSHHLKLRPLADRVLDLEELKYLFPNMPKDDHFSKHRTKLVTRESSYEKTELKMIISRNKRPALSDVHSSHWQHNTDDFQSLLSRHLDPATPAMTESSTENYYGGSFMDENSYESLCEQIRLFDPPEIDGFDFFSDSME